MKGKGLAILSIFSCILLLIGCVKPAALCPDLFEVGDNPSEVIRGVAYGEEKAEYILGHNAEYIDCFCRLPYFSTLSDAIKVTIELSQNYIVVGHDLIATLRLTNLTDSDILIAHAGPIIYVVVDDTPYDFLVTDKAWQLALWGRMLHANEKIELTVEIGSHLNIGNFILKARSNLGLLRDIYCPNWTFPHLEYLQSDGISISVNEYKY